MNNNFYDEQYYYNNYNNSYNENAVGSKSHVTKFFILLIFIIIFMSVKYEIERQNTKKYTYQNNGKTYEIYVKEKDPTFIGIILE